MKATASENLFILLIVIGILFLFIFGLFKCGMSKMDKIQKRVVMEVRI